MTIEDKTKNEELTNSKSNDEDYGFLGKTYNKLKKVIIEILRPAPFKNDEDKYKY